ncbi:MAG: hypothetical protein K2K25_00220 [Muribaculaceae bacterium]|nr:hypothetical protein [Muribaculaceae bacterium]
MIDRVNTLLILGAIALFSLFMTGCGKDDDLVGEIFGVWQCLRFTDAEVDIDDMYKRGNPEEILCSADSQTITLKIISITDPEVPYPSRLHLEFTEWDNEKSDWISFHLPSEVNQPDDFYHMWTEMEDGRPVIKVSLTMNDTGEERKIRVMAQSDKIYYHFLIYGEFIIYQSPKIQESQTFSLRAKYKGKVYTTEAQIDNNGKYTFFDPEYDHLMNYLDAQEDVNMLILDSNTIYYYDKEDIISQKPYEDAMSISEDMIMTTRATGFEDFDSSSCLGYMGLYQHENFQGEKYTKGLRDFHITWNLSNLKYFSMNDKISSIALAYNDDNPRVCTVLTIWDDIDFNYGDDYRSKHRISFVASKYASRLICENLKKIKKIGSSSSWNDCISSISLHFGYLDSLLLDY